MTDLWTGKFGNDYTLRNQSVSIAPRMDLWRLLLPHGCESVLEVGANVGANLEAISMVSTCDLYGCEPNDIAREAMRETLDHVPVKQITPDWAHKLSFVDGQADLVFTSGVLIHVPPDKLLQSMREIHRVAARWIICGEYFAPSEEMIPYRGHDNAMWRRDYGNLYMDAFSDLHCTGTLFAWKRMTGLDNLLFWIFEKGPRRH